ncbi:MAG: hypothetical protein U9N53_02595 [Bacteroidota bacterium]|nr:hypothetical protein [Bacteroidota bacterium]
MKKLKLFFLKLIAVFVLLSLLLYACHSPLSNQLEASPDSSLVELNPEILIKKLPKIVNETSGLMVYDGLIWTINDSGGRNVVYGMNPVSGEVEREVQIKNAKNRDWEAMAIDGEYVYIADVGNNHGTRVDLGVYKVPVSSFNAVFSEVDAEKIYFAWPEQKYFIKSTHNNPWDCEAMLVFEDSLVLFTKDWIKGITRMYVISKEPGKQMARYHSSFDAGMLVTGADLSPDHKTLVMSAYFAYDPYLLVFYDFKGKDFFKGSYRKIEYPVYHDAQTEGVCFMGKDSILVSAERSNTLNQRIYLFSLQEILEYK